MNIFYTKSNIMKKSLLLLAFTPLFATAQCEQAPCIPSQTYTIPISDVNGFNNNSGSKCIVGTGTMGNNLNLNNAQYLSLNGKINVQFPLNAIPKIYTAGDTNRINYLNMDGGDTVIVTSPLIVENYVCNNSNPGSRNVFVLAQYNTYLKVAGQVYCNGSTILTPGNASNSADVVICANVPLPVRIFQWERKGNYIYYKVDKGSEVIELQYAGHASAETFMFDRVLHSESGQFAPEVGLYRLKIGSVYSSVIDFRKDLEIPRKEDNRIFDMSGRQNPMPIGNYIQNGKVKSAI